MAKTKSDDEFGWVDELFSKEEERREPDAYNRLNYALALFNSSTLSKGSQRFEFDLIDQHEQLSREEWSSVFKMLKLNQLRPVDMYAPSQKQIAKWIQQISIDEYYP